MDYGEEYRNLMSGIYTKNELVKIKEANISISGVGGSAGSYLADVLVRKGFEKFILSEPEKYELRNLSRQLFANTLTLGKSKLEMAIAHMKNINPNLVCKIYDKVDADTVENMVKEATVVSYQAEGFSPWVLTQYMCSKFLKPFVNVARKRKDNSRTTIATTIFNYEVVGDIFNSEEINFDSFGIPFDLRAKLIQMFNSGNLDKKLLEEADKLHFRFKKKERFVDLDKLHPEVGSIKDKYPDDYFKRYSDPEICLIAGALAGRAITDLVIGRNTRVFEIDIFSRKIGD